MRVCPERHGKNIKRLGLPTPSYVRHTGRKRKGIIILVVVRLSESGNAVIDRECVRTRGGMDGLFGSSSFWYLSRFVVEAETLRVCTTVIVNR